MDTNLAKLKNGKHWNVVSRDNGDGTTTAEIHGKWTNYLDAFDEWRAINCNIVQEADGFHVTDAPFNFYAPLKADGEAFFESDVRWDIFNKTKITEAPFKQTMKSVQVQPVSGEIFDINGDGYMDAVIYRQAFPQWDADLIYYVKHGRAPRLEKLVRFNSAPKKNIQVEFLIGFSNDSEIENTEERVVKNNGKDEVQRRKVKWDKTKTAKVTTKNGLSIKKKGATQKRGIGMKDFYIWDSGSPNVGTDEYKQNPQKKEKIDVDFERIAAMQYKLTKNVPSKFFDGAVFPVFTDTVDTFYPDPDTETTSVDGQVYDDNNAATGRTWAQVHDGDGTQSRQGATDTGTRVDVLADKANDGGAAYRIARGVVLFDTSSIVDTAVISSAVLSLYRDAAYEYFDNDSYSIGIVQSSPASNTALVAGDLDGFTLHSDTTGATMTIASYATGYNDFTLNATGEGWIDLTGVTKLGVRLSGDYNETGSHSSPPGTAKNSIGFSAADHTGTSEDPKLVITYTTDPSINVNDAITITESVTVAIALQINVNDTISITESLSAVIESFINVSDTLSITEYVETALENFINVNDAVSITESVTVEINTDLKINVNDAISITESFTTQIPEVFIDVNDSITISESVTVDPPAAATFSINVNDSIAISESIDVDIVVSINVNDSVSITESVSLTVPDQRTGLIKMRSKQQEYPLSMDDGRIL